MTSARRDALQRGRAGENAVAEYYESAGYQIVHRNWRAKGFHVRIEVDLVAWDARNHVLVICEVKTRRSSRYGTAAESVTDDKLRRMATAATLIRRELAEQLIKVAKVRLDVAIVSSNGIDVICGVQRRDA